MQAPPPDRTRHVRSTCTRGTSPRPAICRACSITDHASINDLVTADDGDPVVARRAACSRGVGEIRDPDLTMAAHPSRTRWAGHLGDRSTFPSHHRDGRLRHHAGRDIARTTACVISCRHGATQQRPRHCAKTRWCASLASPSGSATSPRSTSRKVGTCGSTRLVARQRAARRPGGWALVGEIDVRCAGTPSSPQVGHARAGAVAAQTGHSEGARPPGIVGRKGGLAARPVAPGPRPASTRDGCAKGASTRISGGPRRRSVDIRSAQGRLLGRCHPPPLTPSCASPGRRVRCRKHRRRVAGTQVAVGGQTIVTRHQAGVGHPGTATGWKLGARQQRRDRGTVGQRRDVGIGEICAMVRRRRRRRDRDCDSGPCCNWLACARGTRPCRIPAASTSGTRRHRHPGHEDVSPLGRGAHASSINR